MAASWGAALQMQESELAEIRAGIAFLRARERTCEARLSLLREKMVWEASLAQQVEAEAPLKDPRPRKPRKSRGRSAVPKDGLTLVQREELALQRQDLPSMDLTLLLHTYVASSSQETRLDLRILAAKFFIQDVTAKNGGSKVLEFQQEVRRLLETLALSPQEHVDLNSAFTKAAKERVRMLLAEA